MGSDWAKLLQQWAQESMKVGSTSSFYFKTFARVALLPYIGGTVAHSLRLIYKFSILEAPFWIHWVIVLVGGYAVLGFILFFKKAPFRGLLDKILYGTVIFHLGLSVLLHLYSILFNTNDWMGVFPMEFSYIAIIYFVGLGLYCRQLGKLIEWQSK